jgi:hypothetical protein
VRKAIVTRATAKLIYRIQAIQRAAGAQCVDRGEWKAIVISLIRVNATN